MPKIGVYICHCGLNIAGTVNVESVADYARKLPDVVIAKHYQYICSDIGQSMIKEDIRTYGLERVVIAACSPRMHEETFRKTIEDAGLNQYLLEVVNLREHCSWVHAEDPEKATEKAKELVRMGIARARFLEPLEKSKISVEKSVLVVGGGIAGIQASLDLANAGLKVYLVEKAPSIGGLMAQLDKTFPTLDCSACILTPRMVEAAQHPNISLITNGEVANVSGFVGNYEVTILKKPRYVDEDKCVGCGLCREACPVKVSDIFNEGMSQTRAISIYSPHAVPNVAIINPNYCLRLKYGKDVCGKCMKVCEAKAINFEQQPETIQLKVGCIILAVGAEVFDARKIPEIGYGRFKNVISNIQFERMSDASGPTGGKILCPESGEPPKSIVFIQCIGSRDSRFHDFCCRVGCMVSLKQAVLAREKLGGDVDIFICFNDIRSFGKGYEEFYKKARSMGINFLAGIPSEVRKAQDGTLSVIIYEKIINKLLEIHGDMVVLACGLIPGEELSKISEVFRIPRSADGFLLEAHPKLRPLETSRSGIFLAGACQGPKDIPDSVAQASGAAAKVIDLLLKGEIDIEPLKAVVNEDFCSGCRICESVCPFDAISIKTDIINGVERPKAQIIDVKCQGCGVCSSTCPTRAIEMQHYTYNQISAQIHAALAVK